MDKDLPRLYLNMIVSDKEPVEIVERSIKSVIDHVDGAYITVTYKSRKPSDSHKLVKLLKKLNANISFYKWTYSFAEARNHALAQVPKGERVFVYWQDSDDTLKDAHRLPELVSFMVANNIAGAYLDYWYQVDVDEQGNVSNVVVTHKRERVVRNDHTWKWVGDLHETLIEQKIENLDRRYIPYCTVVHLPHKNQKTRNIDRNVEILEMSMKKQQGKDPRTKAYLGKAYMDKGKLSKDKGERKIYFDLALNLFHEYLNGYGQIGEEGRLEASGFSEERATIWSHIGDIAFLSRAFQPALEAYKSAIDEAPHFPSHYVSVAMMYCEMEDYSKAKIWLSLASALPSPKTTIVTFPRDEQLRALEVSYQINLHEMKLEWAKEDLQKMLQLKPEEKQFTERMKVIDNLIADNKASTSIVYLGKYLEQIGDKAKLEHLTRAIPDGLSQERFASEMRHKFLPKKIWGNDEIAILCGPGVGQWSPNSVGQGIGGSEEAVIHMANQLTKLGWKVTVYGNPQQDAGIHDGVEYRQWYELNTKDEFNVLILWRFIGIVDFNPKSRYTMVWLHDVPNNPDFTEERLAKVDKVAVLSEYHKSLLRMFKDGESQPFPDSKVFLTSNGIADFSKIVSDKRDSKRLAYVSSPDRGLVYLLRNWSKITQEVPDANLHIYYGFETYDKLNRNNPAAMQWKDSLMKMMQQPGIHYHGKVGHEALAQELANTGIWAYPTDFTEISCISAMKAQALGAIPVVTNYAALQETVRNGIKVDVNIRTNTGQEEYVKALTDLLKDEKQQEDLRPGMMKWAQKYFLWENVAKLWDERFRIAIQNPEKRKEL